MIESHVRDQALSSHLGSGNHKDIMQENEILGNIHLGVSGMLIIW